MKVLEESWDYNNILIQYIRKQLILHNMGELVDNEHILRKIVRRQLYHFVKIRTRPPYFTSINKFFEFFDEHNIICDDYVFHGTGGAAFRNPEVAAMFKISFG